MIAVLGAGSACTSDPGAEDETGQTADAIRAAGKRYDALSPVVRVNMAEGGCTGAVARWFRMKPDGKTRVPVVAVVTAAHCLEKARGALKLNGVFEQKDLAGASIELDVYDASRTRSIVTISLAGGTALGARDPGARSGADVAVFVLAAEREKELVAKLGVRNFASIPKVGVATPLKFAIFGRRKDGLTCKDSGFTDAATRYACTLVARASFTGGAAFPGDATYMAPGLAKKTELGWRVTVQGEQVEPGDSGGPWMDDEKRNSLTAVTSGISAAAPFDACDIGTSTAQLIERVVSCTLGAKPPKDDLATAATAILDSATFATVGAKVTLEQVDRLSQGYAWSLPKARTAGSVGEAAGATDAEPTPDPNFRPTERLAPTLIERAADDASATSAVDAASDVSDDTLANGENTVGPSFEDPLATTSPLGIGAAFGTAPVTTPLPVPTPR